MSSFFTTNHCKHRSFRRMNLLILLSRHIRAVPSHGLPCNYRISGTCVRYFQHHKNSQAMRAGFAGNRRRGNNRIDNGHSRQSALANVPSSSQVIPGAAVSIVLKADQPTGREVQGSVQDVLTRHDHPRGIKVRLTDGRVGRVQRMVNGAFYTTNTSTVASMEQNGLEVITNQPDQFDQGQTSGQRLKYRDMRLDDEPEQPPTTNDLSAYIKPAKQKKRKGQATQPSNEEQPAEEAVCPVCQDFRGDEAAVAHHVQSHFD